MPVENMPALGESDVSLGDLDLESPVQESKPDAEKVEEIQPDVFVGDAKSDKLVNDSDISLGDLDSDDGPVEKITCKEEKIVTPPVLETEPEAPEILGDSDVDLDDIELDEESVWSAPPVSEPIKESPAPKSPSNFDGLWSFNKSSNMDSGKNSNVNGNLFDVSGLAKNLAFQPKNSRTEEKKSCMDGLDFLGLNNYSLDGEKISEKDNSVGQDKAADWNVLLEGNSKGGDGKSAPLINKSVFKKPLLKKKPVLKK